MVGDRNDETYAPVLSIILPVYNVEAFIDDCLNSIINALGFGDHSELIIVDDGSPDSSMDIARSRCIGLTNVIIVQQSNGGLSAARNMGLSHARGRYIWFVDSDDEISLHSPSILLACIARHMPDIIAFEFETIGGTLGRPSYIEIYDTPVDSVAFLTSGRPPNPVQFYAFSRDFIERSSLRFEHGIYHEDALFTPVALARAKQIVRLRDICYRYRLRPGSIMSQSQPAKHLEDMMFVTEKLGRESLEDARGRSALAREVGFALAGVKYYWLRTGPEDRKAIAPISRLIAAAMPFFKHFSLRSMLNYGWLMLRVLRSQGSKV